MASWHRSGEPRQRPHSPDLVESGMLLSFAASRLCGRACDGSLGCHRGSLPATWPVPSRSRPLCYAVPRNRRHWRERPTSWRPANGSARLWFVIRDRRRPSLGGKAGASDRAIPRREGEDDGPARLNGAEWPAVPRRDASPLTPSLLVRAANPRHDLGGAHNAKYRRLAPERLATFHVEGREDIRPGNWLE